MPWSWIFWNWSHVSKEEIRFGITWKKVIIFKSDLIDLYLVKGNKGKGRKKGIYKMSEEQI